MSGPNSRSHLPIPSTQHRSFCTVREGEGLEVGRWNNGTCSRNMMQQCQAVWNGWSICQHQLLLDIWHLEISGNVFDIHSYWGTNMQTWFHGLPQLFFPSKQCQFFSFLSYVVPKMSQLYISCYLTLQVELPKPFQSLVSLGAYFFNKVSFFFCTIIRSISCKLAETHSCWARKS